MVEYAKISVTLGVVAEEEEQFVLFAINRVKVSDSKKSGMKSITHHTLFQEKQNCNSSCQKKSRPMSSIVASLVAVLTTRNSSEIL